MASKKRGSLLAGFEGRVIGVCGSKNVGKTRVVAGLVRYLRSKGFMVGTVKHVHGKTAIEPAGTDSMRHIAAGAASAVAVAGSVIHVTAERAGRSDDQALGDACGRYLAPYDYIVVEGFKKSMIPKVLVTRRAADVPRGLGGVVACVWSGVKPEGLPAFKHGETEKLGRFLLEEGVLAKPGVRVHLRVNDQAVPMNEFVSRALAGILEGFVGSLRGAGSPEAIEVRIARRR